MDGWTDGNIGAFGYVSRRLVKGLFSYLET